MVFVSVRAKTAVAWSVLAVVLVGGSFLFAGTVGLTIVAIAAIPVAVLAAISHRNCDTERAVPVAVKGEDVTFRGEPVKVRKLTKVTPLGLAGVWVLTTAGLYVVLVVLWSSADGLQ